MNEIERIKKYVSIVPTKAQLTLQEMKFYAFFHYGINTFTGREWGTGNESPAIFNPKKQDTDQWCKAVRDAGMKGVILTAKHHDGFCLWQTKTTEHSVKNSPYKNGRGDVVREVAESAEKYGLKFGVYLSPWDRNSKSYGKGAEYNDFYIEQLTELLTGYGEIFMLWLDGACGDSVNGIPPQTYDFERIWSTARRLQPNIVMSGCAPDVRWIGNESGVCRSSEWNVVPKFKYELQNIAANCQDTDKAGKFRKRCEDVMLRDMGSQKFLSAYDEFMWYPAEVDVSTRIGWFYHPIETYTTLKSVRHLMRIYYGAVGGNSLLLLNVPPTKDGLLHKRDVKRLSKMGRHIDKENSLKILDAVISVPQKTDRGYEFEVKFDKCCVDRMRFEEDTTFSQRVENFEIYSVIGNTEKLIARDTVMGFGRISMFKPQRAERLRVVITNCRLEPHIKIAEVYKKGAYRAKAKVKR